MIKIFMPNRADDKNDEVFGRWNVHRMARKDQEKKAKAKERVDTYISRERGAVKQAWLASQCSRLYTCLLLMRRCR